MYEDILQYAIDYGLSQGASYVEARYHKNTGSNIVVRNGAVVDAGISSKEGVGIRVIYEGALAFSSTTDLTRKGVRRAVDKAISLARSSKPLIKEPHALSEERVGRAKYDVVIKEKFEDVPLEDKIKVMVALWKDLPKLLKETKLVSLFEAYVESIEEKTLITSDGAHIVSRVPRVFFEASIVISHPQKGTLQRLIELGGSGGYEVFRTWNVEDVLSGEVRNIEPVLVRGVEPPKEPVDVVVGSEVVGLIVHESAGHPMEADRIWGREAAQAGESYVKPEMIGRERIGNENATVIDDPTIPGSYGFYLYDDEGVPARPRYIYYKGLINEPLHNRWSAAVFNTRSNAAARAMDFTSEPLVRMANTYLEPGDCTFEELIEDIELGVYVKSYMEWNIDDIRWGQRYVGLESYVIRKGELAEPVLYPALEFTTKSFYSSIVAKGKELRFYTGTCGKGEPAQGVPVWFGGPDVRLSKMRVGVAPR
ncbi:MAG: TldD/PmbA family protein [Thermoprotei archaeon]|nr:MAG: TldD/PmbA family protein [Thermoprotei archaeon]